MPGPFNNKTQCRLCTSQAELEGLRTLGSGTFGQVVLAQHVDPMGLRTLLAVKTMQVCCPTLSAPSPSLTRSGLIPASAASSRTQCFAAQALYNNTQILYNLAVM